MKLGFIKGGLRKVLFRQALTRSGPLARRMWHPNPLRTPVYRDRLAVARDAGLGDVLMCTPAFRELKRRNPRLRISFYTQFGDLVRGLPYIDEVKPFAEKPADATFLEYTSLVPSPVHIARLIGDRLGVKVTDPRPDCVIDPARVASYRESWATLPHPHIAVLRRASRFTPNKDWPTAAWTALGAELCHSGTVSDLGMVDETQAAVPARNHVDLRGDTSLPDLVAVIAAADLYVGPVSGPMHVAAATRTPAVAIVGGFEHPVNTHYDGNVEFYTPVPCAPCWLRDPCPFDLRCLHAISPEDVERAVARVWKARAGQDRETGTRLPMRPTSRILASWDATGSNTPTSR